MTARLHSIGVADAVLFDLDGVLTPTARLHAAAWKRAFDELLSRHYARSAARPFEDSDYRLYVDGKPRLDGVRSFLRSRGITLPEGGPGDSPARPTVTGIADRKNELFEGLLEGGELTAYPDAVQLLHWLRARGTSTAVVSASHNCEAVLSAAGIEHLFDARVDGNVADREGLRGKPAPDTFLAAARQLDAQAARCAVIEDAIAGVAAGRAGGFGLVVGVDRDGGGSALLAHGADLVVRALTELIEGHANGAETDGRPRQPGRDRRVG